MRSSLLKIACFSCAFCLLGQAASAQVLLPEEEPAYGLSPAQLGTQEPAPKVEQPAVPEKQDTQASDTQASMDALTESIKKNLPPADIKMIQEETKPPSTAAKAVRLTPGGTLPPKPPSVEDQIAAAYLEKGLTPPPPQKPSPLAELMRKAEAEFKKKYERPPSIFDAIEADALQTKDMKNTVTVGLMGAFTWGETDLKRIEKAFGFARDVVPQKCQIRLQINVMTTDDKPFYVMYLWTGEQGTVKHNGTVKGLETRSYAYCIPPATLPQTGGMLSKLGNYYGIMLSQADCAAPKGTTPASVGIRYDGDSKIVCSFK